MKHATSLAEIKLVGIKCRTNNALEMNPDKAQIGQILQKYFNEQVAAKIHNRKKAGTTYCVYLEYVSDFTEDYTYFIGEEVEAFASLPPGLSQIIIPTQSYTKFTTAPGAMPDVCVSMWRKIWSLDQAELGGERGYIADFEIYDERALDLTNTVLDIYIGIKAAR